MERKPRILCLHGHGASGKILREQLQGWPELVLEKMDLVFIDAPYLTADSGLVGRFDPPYYEWFQANQDYSEFYNFDKCVAYVEDCMVKFGPFDGILGISQAGVLTATFPGMQREGVALTKVPKIKFVIIISGAKFAVSSSPELAKNAFSSPIDIPSLHIIGEKDPTKSSNFDLLSSFVNPMILYHHGGHGVPQHLDKEGTSIMLRFLSKIQHLLYRKSIMETEEEKGRESCCCNGFFSFSPFWTKKRTAPTPNELT